MDASHIYRHASSVMAAPAALLLLVITVRIFAVYTRRKDQSRESVELSYTGLPSGFHKTFGMACSVTNNKPSILP
jgi:hypothetical protein